MRRLALLVIVGMLSVSCGGEPGTVSTPEGGQADTTTTQATTTTDAEAADDNEGNASTSAGEDFCNLILRDEDQDLDISDPEALEDALRAEIDRLSGLVGSAPDEISAEFEEFVEGSEASVELYAEYEFDIFSIPENEMAAIQGQIEGPQNAILDFCGVGALVDEGQDEDGDSELAPVAEDVPEGLFEPPDAQEITDVSGEGTRWVITTTASFGEVRSYYQALLRDDGALSGSEGSQEATFSDTMGVPPAYVLWVKEDGEASQVTIATPK